MKKASKAWVVVDPKGQPIWTTLHRSRDDAIEDALDWDIVMCGSCDWRGAYRKGYRCVRCTVTIDEKGKKQ